MTIKGSQTGTITIFYMRIFKFNICTAGRSFHPLCQGVGCQIQVVHLPGCCQAQMSAGHFPCIVYGIVVPLPVLEVERFAVEGIAHHQGNIGLTVHWLVHRKRHFAVSIIYDSTLSYVRTASELRLQNHLLLIGSRYLVGPVAHLSAWLVFRP